MLLGSLTIGMKRFGLSQRLQSPYVGRSLKALVQSMEAIKTPGWYESRYGAKHTNPHPCNIKDNLFETIRSLRNFSSPIGLCDIFPTHPFLNA
jgi:hypothetical protein